MIHCLLVKVGRNKRGLSIRSERRMEKDILRIGRASECSIHLPDHRVSLHHAHIRQAEDGKLYIDSEGSALNVDGTFLQGAALTVGMKIHIGPYQFVVEELAGTDQLTLSYELLQPEPGEFPNLRNWQPESLTDGWVSKRKITWLLAGLIIVGFMLLPILQAVSPGAGKLLQRTHLNPHQIWSVGALSNAHRLSEAKCMDCHRVPFQPVGNDACLKCHAETKDHGSHTVKNRKITEGVSCIRCHGEHQGTLAMAGNGDGECVACHSRIRRSFVTSELPDVHDFVNGHPEFKLGIRTGTGKADVHREAQNSGKKVKENSNLKFSHEDHIGKVQVPWDMWTIKNLDCTGCHQSDAAGKAFLPINYKNHCFECHQDKMEFVPDAKGRRVPHGSVAELTNTLQDYYAALAFSTHQTPKWVEEKLDKSAKTFAGEDGCGYCHTTRTVSDARLGFDVSPVLMAERWFLSATFSHQRHHLSKCVTCHNVEHSRDSTDIAIPVRKSCLECHAGARPGRNKVVSGCASCHSFHTKPAKGA